MEKFNHYVIQFLKYASPIVVFTVVSELLGYKYDGFIGEVTGWTMIVWCASLIYIFFAIAFSEPLKNKLVRRLAGIKENDEREVQITGNVSKKVFISMMGVFILLLFLSALRVHVYRGTEAEFGEGKKGAIKLGMGMSVVKPKIADVDPEDANRTYMIKYDGLPLSADGVLLLVIALQLGGFYYFSRKENRLMELS